MYRFPERMSCNARSIVVLRIVFGRNPEVPACSALRLVSGSTSPEQMTTGTSGRAARSAGPKLASRD
jgi:hypothetical protein